MEQAPGRAQRGVCYEMFITALLSGGWQRLLLRTTNHPWQFPDLSNIKSSKITCKVQHVSGSHTDTVVQNHWGFFRQFFIHIRTTQPYHPQALPFGRSLLASHSQFAACFLSEQPREGVEMSCLWGGKNARSDGIVLQAEQNTLLKRLN